MLLKIQDIKVVHYQDVEKLIEEIYGFRPDIQDGHYSSGSYIEVEAYDAAEIDEEGLNEILAYVDLFSKRKHWHRGNAFLDLEAIFTDLAIKEVIPVDKYLIKISW